MASAWTGTIAYLRQLFQTSTPSEIISPGYKQIWESPGPSQIEAWNNSLRVLVDSLCDPIFDNVLAIIELQMPVGAERADCVLLGGTKSSPKALIIELKQWAGVGLNIHTGEVSVPGQGWSTHPSIQALNYRGKLRFFNSIAEKHDIFSCAFLHNASEEDRNRLSSGIANQWVTEAPVFIRPEEIAEYVKEKLLPANLSEDDAVDFANAPFTQSQHLFDFIMNHDDAISRDVESVLAETGMGLTEEQRRIKNLVKGLLNNPDQTGHDIIVNGRPGSGKTLLAVSILMMAFKQRRCCSLALRNSRLHAVLKHIFNATTPGLSGVIFYFEPRRGIGIAQLDSHVDVLICDEAQRMEERIMPNVLSKADISVIFLDESQRLNPPEQGTVDNFVQCSQKLGRTPHVMQLPSLIRCTGGQSYSGWVDMLLSTPPDIDLLCNEAQSWKSRYELTFSSSITDLLSALQKKRQQGNKVALVASFTESPGHLGSPSHPDNLRIGFPLASGFSLYQDDHINIPWLMSTSEYKTFWINGTCNDLDRVASIYGCQGFEADYVGVIWGRDLLYRNGTWILGNPNHCYDTIDKLVLGRIPNRRWDNDALKLVLNRYRIFLTRGIKGSVIFCEDEETRKYLVDLGKRINA